MKHTIWKNTVALLLSLMMIGQTANLPALAEELLPDYVPFENAVIASSLAEKDLFLFGSRNMTVSEKSGERRLMKIVRTGDCSAEASVTVKFTDVSANYGENYTVCVYGKAGDAGKAETAEGRKSLVDFMTENAASQVEETPLTNEEIADLMKKSGGYDVVDTEGNVLSSVMIGNEEAGIGEPSDDTVTLTEVSEMEELYEPLTFSPEDNGIIGDVFPGTELRLTFAAGENEQYVAVTPLYSAKAEGDCVVSVSLKDPSDNFGILEDAFTEVLTITDEDAHAKPVLSIADAVYTADGDSVFVTVTRSGAINEMASAHIITSPVTAQVGRDFSGMDAELDFAMGLTSRTVEIPVQHISDDDVTFLVKLISPVNAALDRAEALVTVTSAETYREAVADEEKDEIAYLAAETVDKTKAEYKPYLADSLFPEDLVPFGNAWVADNQFKFSCKGVDYDTWNGGTHIFDNPYLYDGIRIRWQAHHNGWGSFSYTYINTDNRHMYYSEENEWDDTTEDVIFDADFNRELWIGSLTSYFNGIQVQVKRLTPLYRAFRFTLEDADPMTFVGVDSETAKTYTAVQFADELEKVRTKDVRVGTPFAVACPSSQKASVRLAGLVFLDKYGQPVYYQSNTDNDRSVSVLLTKGMASSLATSSMPYERQSDGRRIVNVRVKPVFEYIDAEVTVKPSGIGAFEGNFSTEDKEKTLSFHVGDRLTLSSVVDPLYEGRYVPDGVRYETRDAEGKLLQNGSGSLDYAESGSLIFTVDSPRLVLTPAFTECNNAVKVRISKRDLNSGVFDTDAGLFRMYHGRTLDGSDYVYTMTDDSVHLDQLVCLSAETSDPKYTAVWSLPGGKTFSGSAFYHTAARDAADNEITLTYRAAETYSFSGSVFYADKNLATGAAAAASTLPADGALIAADGLNTEVYEDGRFTLSGVSGVSDTNERLLIWADNRFTVRDVYLDPGKYEYNLGAVTAASNTPDGACFTGVIFRQNDVLVSSTETIFMDGGKLSMTATVQDGNKYQIGSEVYTEHVTGVTFRVLDGLTNEIKSSYPADDNGDGSWTALIRQFSPEDPDAYTYGDIFYVSMTTDRIRGMAEDESGEIPEIFRSTEYAMMSTGYEIIRDEDFEPKYFSMNLPVSAAQILGGEGDNVKREYATLPFIGAIDTVVGVFGFLGAPISVQSMEYDSTQPDYDDYDDFDDDVYEPDEEHASGNAYNHTQVKITITFEKLPYGGTRLKVGATTSWGNRAYETSSGYSSADTYGYLFPNGLWNSIAGAFSGGGSSSGVPAAVRKPDYVYNDAAGSLENRFKASLGNPRMSFSIYFGLYIDFGIIQTTDLTTGTTTGLTEADWELLGGGGFLSGTVAVEWQWMFMMGAVPGFVGVTGTASLGGTLGLSRDPDKVLKYDEMTRDKVFDANKILIDFSGYLRGSVKGYFGVGVPDFLGVRVILGFNAAASYEPFMKETYPGVEDSYGIGLDLTVGGQLDLFLFRLPVDLFSWPFFSMGYTDYFVLQKRANKLVDYTLNRLNDPPEEWDRKSYTDDYLSSVREEANELGILISDGVSQNELQKGFDKLLDIVYNSDRPVISTLQYASIFYLASSLDVFFTASDTDKATLSDEDEGASWERIGSTASRWTADEATLAGTFEPAELKKLVEDSYAQTSAQMLDLGGGRILTAFLMDTSDGDNANPTLVWTVLDTETGVWSEPVPVQDDGTPDFTPNLCDAGDRVLITWASTGKNAEEYAGAGELMRDLDIYAVFLDKDTLTVTEAEQLTDDEYMDSRPSAAYNEEDGAIVLYYVKNDELFSDDPAAYAAAESVITYRLYSETDGWVVDYYEDEMPGSTPEELHEIGEEWGGQRFLSPVADNDRPITDITVSAGYNDLAVFAFTVDQDGDPDTAEDTDLYLRVYEFSTHRSYKPIRITNDDVPQSQPQLIRNTVPYMDYTDSEEGKEVGGSTYLFWLDDMSRIKYISVTDLVRNGINGNGTIKDDYRLDPVIVNTKLPNGESASLSSYQALTDDKDNLYVVWPQVCADDVSPETISDPAALEIFAAAQIRPEPTGDTINGRESVIGGSWSDPVQLTDSGMSNDSVRGVVADNGKLYLTCNRWSVEYIGDDPAYQEAHPLLEDGSREGNPYAIGPTDFMAITLAPACSVEVTDFTFSDPMPMAGDTVKVTANIENTGLTSAKGYTVTFYEEKNGVRGNMITEISSDEWLTAGAYDRAEFEWTVPAEFDGMRILAVSTENDYPGEKEALSGSLASAASYEIRVDSLEQTGDNFTARYTVANTGNADAPDGDSVEIRFSALYGRYDTDYGLEDDLLAKVPLNGLPAKEEKTYTAVFTVPASAFDLCGYDEASFAVVDEEGILRSAIAASFLVLKEPMAIAFGEESLSLTAGDATDMSVEVSNRVLSGRSKILYTSSDSSVFTVDETGLVTAIGNGSATLTALILPYGTEIVLPIEVTGAEPAPKHQLSPMTVPLPETEKKTIRMPENAFDDVSPDDYYYDAVTWALENGITTGMSDTLFQPQELCTRAQIVTFLWRAAGCPEPRYEAPFTDVPDDSWYTKAVCWAAENDIVKGYGDTTFAPDRSASRAETVTILYRYAAAEAVKGMNPFTDVVPSDYYYDAVLWAVNEGITKGTGEHTFDPASVCTRAQIVTFLSRLSDR